MGGRCRQTSGYTSIQRTFWSKRQGAAMAMEKTSLYGLVLHPGRRVNYSKIDPELSRELLIREGLVAGNIICNHTFFAQNRDLLEAVSELEHKRRRHDILVDEQTLFEFYDKRLPADIVSTRHFETWWKKAQKPSRIYSVLPKNC